MAYFITKKENKTYKLHGYYVKKSNTGTPMIRIELQIVNEGTEFIKLVRFDMWNKIVKLLKTNLPTTHENFKEIISQIKGL